MAAQAQQVPLQFGIIGGDDPALAGGDDLHRVKAEHGHLRVPAAADFVALKRPADGVRRVLDDGEAIARGQPADDVHAAGLPGEVHRDDHLGHASLLRRRSQLSLQRGRIDVVRVGGDVDEVDVGAAIHRAVRRGDEAVGGGPAEIAWPQAGGPAGQMQRRGRVADRHRVGGAAISGHARLEAIDRRPLRQVIRAQRGDDGVDVRLRD